MPLVIIFALAAVLLAGLTIRAILEFRTMSAASDRLAASVSALTTSVDAVLAKLATTPADDTAAVTAAADAVDALKAKVDAALATPPAA
jgi:hypothetical protein